jgi:FtsH-binding integral membrane protein
LRISRIIALVYGALCAIAVVIMAVGVFGWFGADRDPVSAAYAIMLSMPWALAMGGTGSPAIALAVVIGGMLLNLAIIIGAGKLLSHRN